MMAIDNPVSSLAPLEYRNALDGATASLGKTGWPIVLCGVPELIAEVGQRASPAQASAAPSAGAALWVEPLAETWSSDLASLAGLLPAGGPLIIVASRPLARLLPETRAWGNHSLGLQPLGLARLRRRLAQMGFSLEAEYGFHSAMAIGLNAIGPQLARLGRPDLCDRLHFAARLRYITAGPFAALSTVALLVARKDKD